jgi:hypothetical protein
VSGVVQNADDENSYIYVPASCYDNNPDAIITRLDSAAGITRDYVINECKSIQITDSRYDFINLHLIISLNSRMMHMNLKIAAIVILVFALIKLGGILVANIRNMKKFSERFYLRDMMTGRAKGAVGEYAVKPVFFFAVFAAGAALFLLLFPSLVEDFLVLSDAFGFLETSYASFLSSDSLSAIGTVVYSLQKIMLASLILLAVSGINAAAFAVYQARVMMRNKSNTAM